MEQFIWNYAPVILLVIIVLVQSNIFVTPNELSKKVDEEIKKKEYMTLADFQAQFQERRALFQEYISENYVSKDSCNNNNSYVTNEISTIKTDLKEDIKELKEDMNKKMDDVQNNVEKLTNVIMQRIEQVERNK